MFNEQTNKQAHAQTHTPNTWQIVYKRREKNEKKNIQRLLIIIIETNKYDNTKYHGHIHFCVCLFTYAFLIHRMKIIDGFSTAAAADVLCVCVFCH